VKKDNQLYAYRRHVVRCSYSGPGGREVRSDKCNCPFHADGIFQGKRIRRQSLKTRSRQIAERRLADLRKQFEKKFAEDEEIEGITVAVALDRFLQSDNGNIQTSTLRKYATKSRLLQSFCQQRKVVLLSKVNIDVLEAYRVSRRTIGQITWKVELQALRTFFNYCINRNWLSSNPAKHLGSARHIKPNDVVPYSLAEEAQILTACDKIGGGKYNRSGAKYEQIRARAMVLVLQATALRISDVCMLRRDAITWDERKATWRIRLRTLKTGDWVYLPIPITVKHALDLVPIPRNAPADVAYYFWNGQTSPRAAVGIAEHTLSAVFKKSGVRKAHAHRFRHTLATRLLGRGVSYERVAEILGNSPAVVRKHYGKWSKEHQDGIDAAIMGYHQAMAATTPVTFQSHQNLGAVS
jgi:integrase